MKLLKSAFPFMILTAADCSIVLGQSASAFTPTSNMTAARIWQTATLFSNGKVLLAGGILG